MESRESIEALRDCGLEGDRYTNPAYRKQPANQLTLIAAENIEAFVAETGLPLDHHEPRRNLVTRGVDLNALVGKRFRIGGAEFEGLELCEPCATFAKATHPQVVRYFVHKGGLNARIVQGGRLCVGDFVDTGE
ncbi:MAG: MOSC domain-containing protein [Gammaproteobacteria bacterium]|jgi:MOSC domain-containing protein YiiM|nr:MOSC domain-containing protein [Gammaproteobacteria bacterium]